MPTLRKLQLTLADVFCRAAAALKGCFVQASGPGEGAATIIAVVLRMLPGGHWKRAPHRWHRWVTAKEAHPPGASRPRGARRLRRALVVAEELLTAEQPQLSVQEPLLQTVVQPLLPVPAACRGATATHQAWAQGAVLPHRVLLHS